jgi:hypothetical protein
MEKEEILRVANEVVNHTNKQLSLGPANNLKAKAKNFGFAVMHRFGQAGNVYRELIPGQKKFDLAEIMSEEQENILALRARFKADFKEKKYVCGRESFVLSPPMFPEIALYAVKAKTGCCGEFSVVSFQRLLNFHKFGNTDKPDIELIRAPGHWMVVINRNKESILKYPSTWNEDSIICDAWNKKVFNGRDYINCWHNQATDSIRIPDAPSGQQIMIDSWQDW